MRLLISILLLLTAFESKAQNYALASNASWSDSVDILHTHIRLKVTDFQNKQIGGFADVKFKSKVAGLNHFKLDLYRLQVDSVLQLGAQQVAFSYNDSLLRIPLTNPLQPGDSLTFRIYYQGQPSIDPTGWGGFYFTTDIAYTLGVGFGAEPHSLGRYWFPCLDNFVERQTFSFSIETQPNHKAYCNGLLTDSLQLPNQNRVWNWKIAQPIPAYLVGMGIGTYISFKDTIQSGNRVIPIEIAVLPSRFAALQASFQNLKPAVRTYVQRFGPYGFDRVGYYMVPFNGGAMEHAANIAYPDFAINGTTSEETLMAHELSHHWWGNWVTCATDSDMWINEGWASFSEAVFLEGVYGEQAYLAEVKEKHHDVLANAHIRDGSFLPVSGVGHFQVYGSHVYKKGAGIAHTLRSTLGDSLFFTFCRAFLQRYAQQGVRSTQMAAFIDSMTSSQIGTRFFRDWVFRPGFPHLRPDLQLSGSGVNRTLTGTLEQKNRVPGALSDSLPASITFWDANLNPLTIKLVAAGASTSVNTTVTAPSNWGQPIFYASNANTEYCDATSSATVWLKNPGTFTLPGSNLSVQVTATLSDSVWLRVTHHWVAPFGTPAVQARMSSQRYWQIQALDPGLQLAAGKIRLLMSYDGSVALGGALDQDLITASEDSITLLFRSANNPFWSPISGLNPAGSPALIKNMGGRFDKRGQWIYTPLQAGEFFLAPAMASPTITQIQEIEPLFNIYPNPNNGTFNLETDEEPVEVKLFALNGQTLRFTKNGKKYTINQPGQTACVLVLRWKNGLISQRKIVLIP